MSVSRWPDHDEADLLADLEVILDAGAAVEGGGELSPRARLALVSAGAKAGRDICAELRRRLDLPARNVRGGSLL